MDKPSYQAVEKKYQALQEYLINYDEKAKSLSMFMDMVKAFKQLPRHERQRNKASFIGLIRRVDDLVTEEYGLEHILAAVTYDYLRDVRKI